MAVYTIVFFCCMWSVGKRVCTRVVEQPCVFFRHNHPLLKFRQPNSEEAWYGSLLQFLTRPSVTNFSTLCCDFQILWILESFNHHKSFQYEPFALVHMQWLCQMCNENRVFTGMEKIKQYTEKTRCKLYWWGFWVRLKLLLWGTNRSKRYTSVVLKSYNFELRFTAFFCPARLNLRAISFSRQSDSRQMT